ncbi:MAG: site-specific DNA-methyltransferase [Flavobacteriales bacterium]
MTKKTKLELTWIGKDQRPKLEPRILLEDPDLSYHAKQRVTDHDLFDNRLIFGDNLLALKALEQEFAGKVKCVYIDPPFNTGAAFEHYDDGLEHSIWLGLMHERFLSILKLLDKDGVLFVHLDDREAAYAKVLLDEVFGRSNYLNTISLTTNDPSGFKATGATVFSTANYILVYAKDKNTKPLRKLFIQRSYDTAYKYVLREREQDYSKWEWSLISDVVASQLGYANGKEAKKELGDSLLTEIELFAMENAERVFRTAAIGGGAAIKRKATIQKSRSAKDQVLVHPNEDVPDFLILNGEQILFYDKRLIDVDGLKVPGELITDVWTDIKWTGISGEGNVEFKNGKKPEAIIRRVLEMSTRPGDLVLDSFGGSGTTGAVAHKMGRRWLMIELMDQCHTHIIPRLERVIQGTDQSGISKAAEWKGGGGFRYFKLAPSLLEQDKWGNWVISKQYNATMLAEAACKLEGFTYAPSDTYYWMQGHSTERDFIYVTTQHLTAEQLQNLSDEVGEERTLLVLCKAFKGKTERWPNLTVRKIPIAVLKRCEWGHDDYSLNVDNLPMAEKPKAEPQQATMEFDAAKPKARAATKTRKP